jgi:replicative DNA helicase
MKRVFISYSHDDVVFRDALATHLEVLRSTGIIHQWHDGQIAPGQDWRAAIDCELLAADIIVLLVSASFLASRYCQDVELVSALDRWRQSKR